MVIHPAFASDPRGWLLAHRPDDPIAFFDPQALQRTAYSFQDGFPGLVSYAVKANPDKSVLMTLCRAGIAAFDVASPREMAQVRAVCPEAALHYHNPVRSCTEIEAGLAAGVVSWSVDRMSELDKLAALPEGTEIAVRLALPVAGAAYDFGSKFGAAPEVACALLRAVAERGLTPSMTFHPGTQCESPEAWARYIAACAGIARQAGVRLARLNVGGGFAAHRAAKAPDLSAIFKAIRNATAEAFGNDAPQLVCEPGRAMVADAVTVALRVKALSDEAVFLNDGLYGALAEWRDLGPCGRIAVMSPGGETRAAKPRQCVLFGPTCDSLDRVPGHVALPEDLAEGDYLILGGMGAYAAAIATRFNGYGALRQVTLTGAGQMYSGHRRMSV
ncbi:type III PLP-dependent enzyme [Aestuariicoccus sp. MJ-SS9]|uniref:type III PLP-dependent enzyme n=1 Tax=Aestuariicoccus sp. MJ-SS9 TaxID=3079855 RepID=UPI0029067F1F|nr:type III PLP-dependent enzyme [Aestuariicoccus sp. MJ-SS9]MDU8911313.1 type III PLP-dependent enzyme [Aestuariicoccus sp. MJ-SS9]